MKQPRILCVDDSKPVRDHLESQLTQYGAQVVLAWDGLEGLDLAVNSEYDLIVTDIEMPGMDGFELCRRIRGAAANRSTPIIILSGDESETSIEKGFCVGASAYVTKSSARTALLPKVGELLASRRIEPPQTILVADDSTSILEIVGIGLTEAGYRVLTAPNGRQALDILSRVRPDLLITDINMPLMTGLELLRRVSEDDGLSSIPVVVMSSEADRDIIKSVSHGGASSFIAKPFNIDALICTIRRLLADRLKILALEKSALEHERLMLYNSISSLIQALEARDPYTHGHSKWVARYTVQLASRIGLSIEDQKTLELAAKLHDIGKIGIRDSILLKQSKLTAEEFALIKSHPVISAKILEPIKSAEVIIPAILHHHEKLDGTGYPDGLTGSAIPEWARIIAVADVYHALTSVRPYRRNLSSAEALEIMRGMRGTHLAGELVSELEDMVAKGLLSVDRDSETPPPAEEEPPRRTGMPG